MGKGTEKALSIQNKFLPKQAIYCFSYVTGRGGGIMWDKAIP
jgi:hypothetical protein